jgi:hypothetical protein
VEATDGSISSEGLMEKWIGLLLVDIGSYVCRRFTEFAHYLI